MKITVSAKPLVACLKAVLPAVPTRPGLSILSGVRLDASEDGLKVEATDSSNSPARRTVRDARVEIPGIVIVPAKALAKTMASAGDQELEFESTTDEGPRLHVRAGARTVTLRGHAWEDWPAIPRVGAIASVALVDAQVAADALAGAALVRRATSPGRS